MFYSIQGEGYFTGAPAFFIRLAGCDVGCPWCDTKESWTAQGHTILNIPAIMTEVRSSGAKIAIVTGGEPLMHNLDLLVDAIKAEGIRAHLETSGTYPLSGAWDWITLSPKPHRPASRLMLESCDELKIVIASQDDLEWAETIKPQAINTYHAYLQPEWSKRESLIPLIISHAQRHKSWRVGLQTHKFLGIR